MEKPKKVQVTRPQKTQEWVLAEDSFQEGLCGGKSRNLATLRSKAPAGLKIPASLVLPFGTFERVLAGPDNKQAASDLHSLLSGLVWTPSTAMLTLWLSSAGRNGCDTEQRI